MFQLKYINENKDEKNDDEKYKEKNKGKIIQKQMTIYKFKNYIRKIKNNEKNICIYTIYTILGLSYLLYFLSLESCFLGEGACSTHFKWIKNKVIEEIISCVLLAIILELIFFKVISKYHLIHIILFFFFCYCYSHGMNFIDHGFFNFFFYFIIITIFIIIMFPYNLIIFCKKEKNRKSLLIYLGSTFFLIFSIYYFYFLTLKSNCSGWTKGLNNTNLENNTTKYGCDIKIPKSCTFKLFKKLQDYTKIMGIDCKAINNQNLKEIFLSNINSSFINKTTKKFGFPLTNKDPICFNDAFDINIIYKYVLENIVDMENKEVLDKYFHNKIPEIEIDFSDKDKAKLIIDVKFNKSLSEERKLLEKNSEPYSNNILLLYIESLSRANALRQLKKTMNFFRKFMPYKGGFNKKYPSEIFHSFQFFKYHSFNGYTTVNYPFLFYGQRKENIQKNLITKYLKHNGYVTCNVHDYCEVENTRTFHNLSIEEVYDHQYLSCDPNDYDISVNKIRCLYGKQNIEYFLNYIEQFWRKYKDNRKYCLLLTNLGHEGTLDVVKYVDIFIADFLYRLFEDNLLKDTSIILLSDHGVGMPSVYYLYDFYKIELHLPAFFIIINDRKNISYEIQYKFIQENQQAFITAFDIYNTIGNLIYGDQYINISNKTLENDSFKSELGISLFNKINPKERFPKKYLNYSSMIKYVCK